MNKAESVKESLPAHVYQELLENMPDTIMITTLQGKVRMWNKGAQEVFGYTKEEMIGSPVGKIYMKENLEKIGKIKAEAMKGRRITDIELTEISKEGKKPRFILLSLLPLRDSKGDISWLGGIGKDITKMKELQERLMAAKRLEAVHNMVITLNHEMNQPLTVIYGFIQFMSEEVKAGKAPSLDVIEKIQQQSERLSELLKRITKIKRIALKDYLKGTEMIDIERSIEEG